ncbi:hypothetical protein ABII15_23955 [Streptomyces sp. HUAS MG91]|uniref:DUF3806 domain-containing protein n=1 Tax=Streptomyces tabacisoli TaxID=3156398 RepID=A0AAU8J481_9ACTN
MPEGGKPAAAAEMRKHADGFVARVASSRLPLDYTVASLRVVDFLIDGLRKGRANADPARLDVVLFGLGAYVGEVLARRAGAVWVDLDEAQRAYFGQWVGVRMPDGRVWSPLGKVVNRYEVGAEESLQTFYLTLPGRAAAPRPATERESRACAAR